MGWVISHMRHWIVDPLEEITFTLFTPYAAYIPAEELGVSGVLATVAAGLYLGWRNPETTAPRNRLQLFALWEVLPFLRRGGPRPPRFAAGDLSASRMAPAFCARTTRGAHNR